MMLEDIFKSKEFKQYLERSVRGFIEEQFKWNSPIKDDLQKKVADRMREFMKKTEYQDVVESALQEYITKDVAKKIVELGVAEYVNRRRGY